MRLEDHAKIVSLGMAVPEKSYTQEEVFKNLQYPHQFWMVYSGAGIEKRHFWMPIGTRLSFQQAMEEYQKAVKHLGTEAIRDCVDPRDISRVKYFVFSSCTGYQCPSMNYQLARDLQMNPKVEFVSNVGDGGCAGAIPSMVQAWKHSQWKSQLSLAVSCEVSSVCYFPETQDGSTPFPDPTNKFELLRANAIFGDGASAALFGFDSDPSHPYVVDYQSYTDYDKQDYLGFRWRDNRLACMLSPDVPKVAPGVMEKCISPLLERYGLKLKKDISWLMCHPGGKAVIENFQQYFSLPDKMMELSYEALKRYGNCSSTSVGLLGKYFMEEKSDLIRPGDWGLVVTVGSGMNANAMLLKWPE